MPMDADLSDLLEGEEYDDDDSTERGVVNGIIEGVS